MIDIERLAAAICLEFYSTKWENTSEFRKRVCRELAKVAHNEHIDILCEAEWPVRWGAEYQVNAERDAKAMLKQMKLNTTSGAGEGVGG